MDSRGIFCVTGSDLKIRELELHLSRGNYAFLKQVNDPHVVACYWKRLLRDMKVPLVTFDLYNLYSNLDDTITNIRTSTQSANDKMYIVSIKKYLQESNLPKQHRNTLKFHCGFFNKVAEYEKSNSMNLYNLSVCVGPNILRPQWTPDSSTNSLLNEGKYYEIFMQMIEHIGFIFDEEMTD